MKLYTTLFFISSLFIICSCKDKSPQQKMLTEIEHYNIDTIKAKPIDTAHMDRADSCRYRADNVLRKYPEMYHATDQVTTAYRKWADLERDFIQKVFVGKDRTTNATFSKARTRLDHRLQQLNFIEPLTAIIIDGQSTFADTKLTATPDDKAVTEYYRKPMFMIRDGISDTKTEYSTDEMRSACEKARRAWLDYIHSTDILLKTMPDDLRPIMQQAVRNIVCLHAIDLRNCYAQYWFNGQPGFVLKDDCPQDVFDASSYEALSFCPNMEKN